MHTKAKKLKQLKDADIESSNTPSYEQGKRRFNDMGHKVCLENRILCYQINRTRPSFLQKPIMVFRGLITVSLTRNGL